MTLVFDAGVSSNDNLESLDPARRALGEEPWVEVNVPKSGPPRPIRLGVKKGEALTPLEMP